MSKIIVRKATIEDAALIQHFVYELAKEEKAEHEVETNKRQLINTLFGKNTTAHAVVCEMDPIPAVGQRFKRSCLFVTLRLF